MAIRQALELPLVEAIAESTESAETLGKLAAAHRRRHLAVDTHQTIRHWVPDAGTWCYQTHIAISGQTRDRLYWLAETLYNASTLDSQPWYPQFLGGESQPTIKPVPPGIHQHQLALGRFDLGVGKPRYYRQLLSMAWPDDDTAILVARSVDTGPALGDELPLAYTLAPNGEVLYWADERLHWHHICCTPGARVLPGIADRWLINALRLMRLDGAEKRTYRDEALGMRNWLRRDGGPAAR